MYFVVYNNGHCMNDDHKIMMKFWQKSFETPTKHFGHEEVLGIVYNIYWPD